MTNKELTLADELAHVKTALAELMEKAEALLRCEIAEGACNVQALLKAIAKTKAVLE